jgi:Na+/glutamate symporter
MEPTALSRRSFLAQANTALAFATLGGVTGYLGGDPEAKPPVATKATERPRDPARTTLSTTLGILTGLLCGSETLREVVANKLHK